ncbi:MAG: hypothetical protein K6C94_02300 [Candidatus Gastranaerophilales bacterium]|nr:hypothetical protein [Candidatus Gastranaerophilales bacterium]
MIKLYTDTEYNEKITEANNSHKKLYIHTFFEDEEKESPVYQTVKEPFEEVTVDENGNEITTTVEREVLKPVMIDVEEQITTIDENGEEVTETVTNKVQKTETITVQVEYAELLIAENGYYVCYRDNLTDGTVTSDFEANKLARLKQAKNAENTAKAKQSIENGYVVFKNAQFETNAQTVGDLTATMLIMQTGGLQTFNWLSKDDKSVELTVEDIGILGGLIADFKSDVWNEKYLFFKMLIAQAQTVEDVMGIQINYAAP